MGLMVLSAQAKDSMVKLCGCNCGQPAPIAKHTDRRSGWIKGEPKRFISGHHARLQCRHDLRAEFYSCVDLNGPVVSPELGPCWLWLGCRTKDGYGQIRVNGRLRRATHIALELEGYYMISAAFGKRQVGHLCDTPGCVRVSHLKIWTAQDDADDKRSKGRQARGVVHGERHGSAKLNRGNVEEIRTLYQSGVRGRGYKALAKQFGVTRKTIWKIISGKTWNPEAAR